MFWIIYLAIAVGLVLFAVSIYNSLVKKKNLVEEAWSSIDVQLKKRYNLIPNLVETVKGFAAHERGTFEEITKARNLAQAASTVPEQQAAEKRLNQSMMNLFAVAENYPELKSNTNFLNLQEQLSAIEGDIEKARRYYNGTVRSKNIAIETFPSSIFANMFNFEKSEYFELEDLTQRENPEVKF